MGWQNPDVSWAELERRLSGRPKPKTTPSSAFPEAQADPNSRRGSEPSKAKSRSSKSGSPKSGSPKAGSPKAGSPKAGSPKAGSPKAGSPKAGSPKERPRPWEPWGDGDGSPGWEHKPRYEADPKATAPRAPAVPYAELHAHSDFSFLDGASDPESLIEEAVRLGLHALALTDHDGFYGASRFAEAAKEYELKTVFGAELSLGLRTPQNGIADPEGEHLLVLAAGVSGYHRLAGAITEGQLRGDEKGRPVYDVDELAAQSGGDWMIMTGCRKGAVRRALVRDGVRQGIRVSGGRARPADRAVRSRSRRRRVDRSSTAARFRPQRRLGRTSP